MTSRDPFPSNVAGAIRWRSTSTIVPVWGFQRRIVPVGAGGGQEGVSGAGGGDRER